MIPTFLPLLEQKELSIANQSLRERYLGIGKYVEQFEKYVQINYPLKEKE